MNKVDQKEKWQ